MKTTKEKLFCLVVLFVIHFANVRAQSCNDVEVTFDLSSNTFLPCDTIEVTAHIDNNTDTIFGFWMGMNFSGVDYYIVVDNLQCTGFDSYSPIYCPDTLLPGNTDTTFYLRVKCDIIPDVTTEPGPLNIVIPVKIGIDAIVCIKDPILAELHYPNLVRMHSLSQDTLRDVSLGSFTREFIFQNNGTDEGVFNGWFRFHDPLDRNIPVNENCNFLVLDSVEAYVAGNLIPEATITNFMDILELPVTGLIPFVTSSGNPASLSQIIIKEYFRATECAEPGCRQRFEDDVHWGCDLTGEGLCKTIPPFSTFMDRGNKHPLVYRSHSEPAEEYVVTLHDSELWTPDCPGTFRHWNYIYKNFGNDTAYNVTIALSADTQSFTYIFRDSIEIDACASCEIDTVQNSISLMHTRYPGWTTNCLSGLLAQGDTMLGSIEYKIPKLPPDSTIDFSFVTYYCCGNDERFFNVLKYNCFIGTRAVYSDECYMYEFGSPFADTTNITISWPPEMPLPPGQYADGNPWYLGSYMKEQNYDLNLAQSFETSITDMTGPHTEGDTTCCTSTLICPDTSQWFIVENKSTMSLRGVVLPHLRDQMFHTAGDTVPHGDFVVRFELDPGLQIFASDTDSIYLKSPLFTDKWVNTSVVHTRNGYDHIYEVSFPLDSFVDTDTLETFMRTSSIYFKMGPCCPAPAVSNYDVKSYLRYNPDTCDDCKIPLSKVSGQINVHCPGCVTPGIVVSGYSLLRDMGSMGYQDTENNRMADTASNGSILKIVASYLASHPEVNRTRSIVGDTLLGTVSAYFVDGDDGNDGISFSTWNGNFNHDTVTNKYYLKYLYLDQNIQHSNSSSGVNLEVLSDTLFIYSIDNSDTCFTNPIKVSLLVNTIQRSGDNYFYNFSLDSLYAHSAPSCYKFRPNDQYTLKTWYRVCKNFQPGIYYDNPDLDLIRKESEITNQMYLSATHITTRPAFGSTCSAGEEYDDGIGAASLHPAKPGCSNGIIYYCETFGGMHFFYATEQRNTIRFFSTNECASFTDGQLLTRTGNGDLGRAYGPYANVFPYEFRLPAGHMIDYKIAIELPEGYSIVNEDFKLVSNYNTASYSTAATYQTWTGSLSKVLTDSGYVVYNFPSNLFVPLTRLPTTNNTSTNFKVGDEACYMSWAANLIPEECEIPNDTLDCRFSSYMRFPNLNCTGDTFQWTPRDPWPGPCIGFIIGTPKPKLLIEVPDPLLEAGSKDLCWDFEIHNTFDAHAENHFLFFETTPNFTIDTLICLSSGSGVDPDANGFYDLGSLIRGFSSEYRLCGTYSCVAPDHEDVITFYTGSACGGFPDSMTDAKVCTLVTDQLRLRELPYELKLSGIVTSPSSYSLCETTNDYFHACVTNSMLGGISSLVAEIKKVEFLELVPEESFVYLSTSSFSNYQISFLDLTPCSSDPEPYYCYSLEDALLDGGEFRNNDQLCFDIKFRTYCGYQGELTELRISAESYCGDAVQVTIPQNSWTYDQVNNCDDCDDCTVNAGFTYSVDNCGGVLFTDTSVVSVGDIKYRWYVGNTYASDTKFSDQQNPYYPHNGEDTLDVCVIVENWEYGADHPCAADTVCAEIPTPVSGCGGHCTYTQGYYGNSGGRTCDGKTTTELLTELLSDSLMTGTSSNHVTIYQNQVSCLISKLPVNTTPTYLPNGPKTCATATGSSYLTNNGRFKNVLLGQAITLGLNLRLDTTLADMELDSAYFTTYESTACISGTVVPGTALVFHIPQIVIDYLDDQNDSTVADLLTLANQALGGSYVPSSNTPSYADITAAVDAINKGFDKCRIIVGFSSNSNPLRLEENKDEEIIYDNTFKIYPNPNNGNMQMDYTIADNGIFILYDYLGRERNRQMLQKGQHTLQINRSDLSNGIYYGRVVINKIDEYNAKIIIIK